MRKWVFHRCSRRLTGHTEVGDVRPFSFRLLSARLASRHARSQQCGKGVYIDLLASMYARGGPIPTDERELCRICGCSTARSLRPLLAELISKDKLKLEDGHLTNGLAMEEIAKFERRKAISSKGGRTRSEAHPGGVRPEFEPSSTRTQPETRTDIE